MRFVIAAALIAATIPNIALADIPGRNWISSERASAILAKRGYRVTKIAADDGHWEGEATRRGRNFEFHVNPHNGQVTKLQADR